MCSKDKSWNMASQKTINNCFSHTWLPECEVLSFKYDMMIQLMCLPIFELPLKQQNAGYAIQNYPTYAVTDNKIATNDEASIPETICNVLNIKTGGSDNDSESEAEPTTEAKALTN